MTGRPGPRLACFLAALFAANAVSTYMPLWFADRGLSPAAIGQVLGLASICKVFSGPVWGTISDWLGRRRPVMAAAAASAMVMSLTYFLADGFTPILIVAAIQGIAASAAGPLADSLALALTREGRMEYGPVRAAGSVSYMIATAAAGQGLALFSTAVIPAIQALGHGLAAICALTLMEARTPAAGTRRLMGGWVLLRVPGFRLAVTCTALIQGSHAAYYGFAALSWRSQGIDDGTIGLLFAEGIIAEILLFYRGRRLATYLGPAGLTACAASAAIVRWGWMAFTPPLAVLAVLQLTHAASFAMQHLSAMTVLSQAIPPERAATAQALHSALGYGAPTGLMMLLSGYLYSGYGGLAFLAMAVCAGLSLFCIGALRRVTRSSQTVG